jgi:Protein of unknown function (DUF3102)
MTARVTLPEGMSNRLAILAAEIRQAHTGVQDAAKTAAKRAIEVGLALIEAKSLLKHGEWLPWLQANCAVSERTARLYIRLATNRERIELQIGNVADLTVRGAIALIAAPRKSHVVEFAHKAADAVTDDLDLVDFEEARAENNIRRAAFADVGLVLANLVKLGWTPAAAATWDLLGEQLMSAIADEMQGRVEGAS